MACVASVADRFVETVTTEANPVVPDPVPWVRLRDHPWPGGTAAALAEWLLEHEWIRRAGWKDIGKPRKPSRDDPWAALGHVAAGEGVAASRLSFTDDPRPDETGPALEDRILVGAALNEVRRLLARPDDGAEDLSDLVL